MSEYSVEEVRKHSRMLDANQQIGAIGMIRTARDMLTAYADLREQIERAREGVPRWEDERDRIDPTHALPQYRFVEDELNAYREIAYLLPNSATKDGMTCDFVQAFIDAHASNKGLRLLFEEDREDCRKALLAVAHLLPSERGGVEVSLKDEHEPDCNLNMASIKRQFMGCDCKLSVPSQKGRPPAQAAEVYKAADAFVVLERLGWEWVGGRWMCGDIADPSDTAEPVAQGEAVDEIEDFGKDHEWDGQKWVRKAAQPASPEQPAGRQGQCEALIAQWRKEAPVGSKYDINYRSALRRCADELERAMRNTHPAAPVGVGVPDVSNRHLAIAGVPSKYWDEARKAYALAAAPSAPRGME